MTIVHFCNLACVNHATSISQNCVWSINSWMNLKSLPFCFNLADFFYWKMEKKPYHQEDGRTSLVFSVRGPIPIQLDDSTSSWGSGSSVLDLIFPTPETGMVRSFDFLKRCLKNICCYKLLKDFDTLNFYNEPNFLV